MPQAANRWNDFQVECTHRSEWKSRGKLSLIIFYLNVCNNFKYLKPLSELSRLVLSSCRFQWVESTVRMPRVLYEPTKVPAASYSKPFQLFIWPKEWLIWDSNFGCSLDLKSRVRYVSMQRIDANRLPLPVVSGKRTAKAFESRETWHQFDRAARSVAGRQSGCHQADDH